MLTCLGLLLFCIAPTTQPTGPAIVHLPGISGALPIDLAYQKALARSTPGGEVVWFDWTHNQPSMAALTKIDENRVEAEKLAKDLIARRLAQPDRMLIVSAHSGGAGPAIWALEQLPEGVSIDALILLQPAISPTYDLTKALEHVKTKAIVFSSPQDDYVLGLGTRTFGTIDRVYTNAAGMVGFTPPPGGMYEKLLSMPYSPQWSRLGNDGDHIGPLMPRFVQKVLGPELQSVLGLSPASQPGKESSGGSGKANAR